jgi:hypothetical protein
MHMTRWRFGVLVGGVGLLVLLLVGLHSTEWSIAFGGKVTDARRARVEKSPQWNTAEGKFQNPLPTHKLEPGTFWQMVRGQFLGGQIREPPRAPPTEPRKSADYATPPASGLRATWIGHASALVEIDGARVLFDPIFADRCSPSTLVGPRRFFPPPIALGDLPAIDAVVISHDHFDHLDMVTARVLAARGTHYFVPLGIGAHLEAWKIPKAQIHELDWHESGRAGPLSLTAASSSAATAATSTVFLRRQPNTAPSICR